MDLIIDQQDSVYVKVSCEKSIAKELSDFFTFTVPGHKYMPAFRNKYWDGKIKLYNVYTQEIYAGLIDYVIQFAKDRSYTYENNVKDTIDVPVDLNKFIEHLNITISGKTIEPYDYQKDAILHALKEKRALLLSPTGSGKSLIIYVLCRYILNLIPKDKKILIIVPTISLVSQMYSDFADYSGKTEWKPRNFVHKIFGGEDKNSNKRIVVSTWQSIYKLPNSYFEEFECVFGDECHLFKSKSLTAILTKLKNCPYRIGTTGTLDGSFTHKLVIEGLFGKVKKVTSTKELMDQKVLSNLSIDCIVLKYPAEICNTMKKAKYAEEIEWLVLNQKRNEFITKLALSLKGNTLVLFQFVEKHGKVLYEMMKEQGKTVFFVFGGTDIDDREKIRKIVEKEENAIIIASYGTFSTGISIKRLHNIVFSSPSKSRIRVLQSIGRQLRKSEFKEKARLYDIADDLSWKSYRNHTLRHFVERIKIYESEKFEHRKIIVPVKES
jgi:superfamily II DNA or RNA helicase